MNDKPTLTLNPGEDALDLNSLMDLYTSLTGKKPSPAELEEVRAMLDHTKAEDAAKAKP
ncbi:hypothetical protein [Thiocapsa roseopersicina]|uniref:Uncharacterized protein n=1 Tax=Thiocapsa roseopersicina TaxID=1058 RepID=A0A1H3DY81_THIRO|nr:hypothetical protein [Thiocapsa roseopersicina]SDX71393.1 hypothetical protein SAMN05421783_1702 [Thiocapsa roseopersicina]